MKNLKKLTVIVFSMILMLSFAQAAFADDAQKININKASSAELCKLKNIGPACADRIIKYRESNGPFEKTEDLQKVKGIGPKTYENIKNQITVQ
jgi:competence protein ComEA